jgi:hypothetical protein
VRDAIRHNLGAAALLCALAAPAQAAPVVDWADAFRLEPSGGLTDPVVLIGFNPQPDPPVRITTLDLRDPTAPRLVITGQSNPQTFVLFLAIGVGELNGDPTSMDFDLPPLPGADLSSYGFRATGDGSVHDVLLTFSTSSAGIIDGTSIVGFNPQPDPPGNFGAFDVMGLEFSFTTLSDAIVTLQITDQAGAPLSLTAAAVPEPATLSLVGLGAAAMAWSRRRRARGTGRRRMP